MVDPERVSSLPDALQPDPDVGRGLGSYHQTVATARESGQLVLRMEAFIAGVNEGIPEGHRVGTFSTTGTIDYNATEPAFRGVYQPGEAGRYVRYAGIDTDERTLPFLGDRLEIVDGVLVVIDDRRQLGLQTGSSVFVANMSEATSPDGEERARMASRAAELLRLIASVESGTETAFSYMG